MTTLPPATRASTIPDQVPQPDGGELRPRVLTIAALAYIGVAPLEVVSLPIATPPALAGLAFLMIWGATAFSKKGTVVVAPRYLMILAVLVVWTALTTVWSYSPSTSLSMALSTGALALSAVAVAQALPSARTGIPALIVGGVVLSALVLVSPSAAKVGERTTYGDADENLTGFSICISLAASLFVALDRGYPRPLRIGGTLAVLPLTAAVLMSGSRTGFVTLIVLAVVVVVFSLRSGSMGLILGASAAALAFLTLRFLEESGRLPTRIVDFMSSTSVANDIRGTIIDGFRSTQDTWVLHGVGVGADADYLSATTGWYRNAHNWFWATWIELGIVGLAVSVILIAMLIPLMYRSTARRYFILTAAPVLAYAYSLSTPRSNALWVVIGLALCSATYPTTGREALKRNLIRDKISGPPELRQLRREPRVDGVLSERRPPPLASENSPG